MGEVVNLRQARKARDKAAKVAKAAANRQLHGRTKAEKELARSEDELAARRLDAHRREPGEEP